MNYPTRKELLLGTGALSTTLFFFVPCSVYLNNTQEFFTTPRAFLLILLLCAGAAFGLLSLVCLPAPPKIRGWVLSFLAFLCAASWVQAYVLNWDYGVLDGAAISWTLLEPRSFLDAGVWSALFLFALIFGIWRRLSFRALFVALILMQAANLLIVYAGRGEAATEATADAGDVSINLDNQFVFSRNRNIILIVLDAYQTDVFNEYLETHPEAKERLPGFTYYPDAVTETYFTEFSIPSMLTGTRLIRPLFPNSRAFSDVMNDRLMNRSIPALLKKAGYYVGIYTSYAHRYYPPSVYGDIADNYAREAVFAPHYAGELERLMAVSLFRLTPHALKNAIHQRFLLDTEFDQDRDVFMHGVEHDMRLGTDAPCFKYYHLQGLHAPQVVRGELLDWLDRSSTLQIADLVNEMLISFTDRLRDLRAYDTADILIIGDHGIYWDAGDIAYGQYADGDEREGVPLDVFVKKPRALPLLLFKPAGAQGPLAVSEKPVCLSDILPTVLDAAGIAAEESYDGISLLDASAEDTPRVRAFFTNGYRQRLSDPMYEFLISGFSWYTRSWTYTGNLHSNARVQRVPLDNYPLGRSLSFGRFGSANQYLLEHWEPWDESHGVSGDSASLQLPLAEIAKDLSLHVDVAPVASGQEQRPQAFLIYINDTEAGTFTVAERQTVRVDIPHNPAWDAPRRTQERAVSQARPWLATPPPLSHAMVTIRIAPAAGAADDAPETPEHNSEFALEVFSMALTGAGQ